MNAAKEVLDEAVSAAGLDDFGDPIKLIGEASVLRHKHNAGGRGKQGYDVGGDQVRPKDEHPA